MNNLQIFENSEFGTVRTVEENGSILFCGSDVAKILGYSNTRDALAKHCRYVAKRDGVSHTTNQHGKTTQQTVEMTFIPECDIYRLISHSKLPGAEKFERWVFEEVLPAVRRNGIYAANDLLDEPELLMAALRRLKDERERNVSLIRELQEKASYCDMILRNESLIPISVIAKDYGMSGMTMNTLLHELKIQYKIGDTWLLYQKYADCGYAQTNIRVIGESIISLRTYWTHRGKQFLHEFLREKRSLIPVIEREGEHI